MSDDTPQPRINVNFASLKLLPPFLSILLFTVATAPGEESAGVPVDIPAYSVEGVAQPMSADRTAVVVTAGGKTIPLPTLADTSLWKEGKTSSGTGLSLALRDGRWSQGLIKPDLSSLPKDAPIENAVFRFKVGGVERSGNARFQCYRMLVDWSESATWFKPDPDQAATWNGLKAGVDFEAEPFASVEVADLKKGDAIEILGFGGAIQQWVSGAKPNFGFLITLSGKALQTSFPSREAGMAGKDLALGGPLNSRVIAKFDPALVARILVQPADLLDATLRLRVTDFKKAPAGATLRVLTAENKLLGSVPLAGASSEGWVELKGLAEALRALPAFVIESSAPLHFKSPSDLKWRPQYRLTVRDYPKATLFDHDVKPQPGIYNTVKDGHFSYGGKRLRLWGVVGFGEADRMRKMGFNAQRVWEPSLSHIYQAKDFPADLAKRGELPPTVKGDGSEMDLADKHFADLKAHGMFVMFAALTDSFPLAKLLTDDSFIAGGADWADWKAAVATLKDDHDIRRYAIYFDDRLQKVRQKSAEALLNHVNPYTGQRYAEEENIAVYEVWNENGALYHFLNDGKTLPPFFEREAQARWSNWLTAKYHDEAALKTAWGRLETSETLQTVKLGPTLAQRDAFPAARGQDYVQFLSETVAGYDKAFRAYCRTLAPAGRGVNVAPFSFDTQYRPSLPWLQVDAQGDVNCPGMYFWTLKSALGAPPSAYVIDNHTVDGVPTVLYETNQSRPNPARAEYPLKLAALASWQDWDGIFWHYWAAKDLVADEEYLAGPMAQLAVTHYWTGVQHERDPIMTSAMALAGRIFLNQQIKPAPAPAIYHVGQPGIAGFDFANGLGSSRATFERGSRIRFEPKNPAKLTVDNEVSSEPVTAAVKSGEELFWDWPNSRLIIDTPTVKAYVGKVSAEPWKFRDGTVLSGLTTPWICWALSSADGRPLSETKRAYVTAVADAKNTGFDFDWTVAGGPVEQAKAIRNSGRAPVVMDKVSYTLSFPTQSTYSFAGYDFATRKVLEIPTSKLNVLRVRNQELWMGTIEFSNHGAGMPAVEDPNTGAIAAQQHLAAGGDETRGVDPKLAAVWNPLPGLHWGDSFVHTQQIGSKLLATVANPSDITGRTVNWNESKALFASPANIEIAFKEGRMSRIAATFTRPPNIKDVVAAYEKQFGPALEKVFASQEQQSIARWSVKQPSASLEIKVTEAQGTQIITYELAPSR